MRTMFISLVSYILFCACSIVGNYFDERVVCFLKENTVYTMNADIDLKGKELLLPKGVTLQCSKGCFRNGTIIGNDTKILGSTELFDDVLISGTWNVPEITTSFFRDFSEDNTLLNLFKLTNSKVHNKVIIKEGDYYVTAPKNGIILELNSNTDIQLDGNIILRPNDLSYYAILFVRRVENIIISGVGSIIGDKNRHQGKDGEWGMGVHIADSKNVSIIGIKISDCWGDCICVGNNSSNIRIDSCLLENGRRQGISVSAATKVVISNCLIKNIFGTAPEYAIDIEPNKREVAKDIIVKDVTVEDCAGGLMVYGRATGAIVTNVSFEGCHIAGRITKTPISLIVAEDIRIINCESLVSTSKMIEAEDISDLRVEGNSFISSAGDPINLINCTSFFLSNNFHNKKRIN